MMKCKKCDYPIFSYSQCCPMCGRKVEMSPGQDRSSNLPQTRFGFWVAGLTGSKGSKKPPGLEKLRRTASA